MNARKMPALVLGLIAALLWVGCGSGNNACVGTGSDPLLDSCFQNENDASSCNAFNGESLNGDTWTFHDGKTCSEVGFDYRCTNGTYKLGPDYCS